jgi:hypothetical protein
MHPLKPWLQETPNEIVRKASSAPLEVNNEVRYIKHTAEHLGQESTATPDAEVETGAATKSAPSTGTSSFSTASSVILTTHSYLLAEAGMGSE